MGKRKDLFDNVVVITGPSSGVGRAAAVERARCGCKLALAARRAPDLEETARLCRDAGGKSGADALIIVADVTCEDEMQHVIDETLKVWGRIDVWVNNAGVTLFAKLTDASFDEHRRVIETNLIGAMLGARLVLPVFREQLRGTLINVGSVLSDTGWQARAMPPVQAPETVARALVDLISYPRRELHVPRMAAVGVMLRNALPSLTERLVLRSLQRWHFDEHPSCIPSAARRLTGRLASTTSDLLGRIIGGSWAA